MVRAACALSMQLSLNMRCAGPCKDIPDRGGFACCRDESCHTQTPGPPRTYRFEYNVTFRHGAVPPTVRVQCKALHGVAGQSSSAKQPCMGRRPCMVGLAYCVLMRAGTASLCWAPVRLCHIGELTAARRSAAGRWARACTRRAPWTSSGTTSRAARLSTRSWSPWAPTPRT